MRVLIATQPHGVYQDRHGNTQALEAATYTDLDGNAVPVYAASTGDATLTSAVTNANGEIPGYLDEDTYLLTIGDRVNVQVEVVSGRTRASRAVIARRDSNQTITTAVFTPIQFQFIDEEFGADDMWDYADPSKIVAQVAGVYLVEGEAHWAVATGGTARFGAIKQNGVDFISSDARPTAPAASCKPACQTVMMPGDYVELQAWHDRGSNLDVSAVRRYTPHLSVSLRAPLPYSTRIVSFGDSLSEGEDATLGYVSAIRPLVPTTHVLARGIAGQTSTQIAARVASDVVAHNPQTAVILAGTNDIITDVAVATIEANLTTIYNACDAAGIDILALTVPPFGSSVFYTAGRNTNRNTLNTWIKAQGHPVLDADALLWNPSNHANLLSAYDYGDGVHLSPAGNLALAEAIVAAI